MKTVFLAMTSIFALPAMAGTYGEMVQDQQTCGRHAEFAIMLRHSPALAKPFADAKDAAPGQEAFTWQMRELARIALHANPDESDRDVRDRAWAACMDYAGQRVATQRVKPKSKANK